ncbi:MAG: hypothetical protein IJV70_01925 [Clostridia bacterium]|nr:hypothetical protein [Clostridia bacterium]
MKIHSDFEGGNIKVLGQDGNTVFLQNDMRDSTGDWFYWAFCVEGAEGQSLTFSFDKNWVGYYGAAVSRDGVNWHWSESREGENSFSYTFAEDEIKVYFAHDLMYSPARLFKVFDELGVTPKAFCISKKGREVPYLTLGDGSRNVFLTSRHHACESTGTYVMEGLIREFIDSPIDGVKLHIIPFMDCDGVYDGDQGKNRYPHDHNRDYIDEPVYFETAALMKVAREEGAFMSIDFHSPYHIGGVNDRIFIVRKFEERIPKFERFGELFENECGENTLIYKKENDMPPNTAWNVDNSPTCAAFFKTVEGCDLSFTLETTYFGKGKNKVSAEKLINTGRAFCRALEKYSEK